MKTYEFRAWDKEYKRMITNTQDFIPLTVSSEGVFVLSPKHEENLYKLVDADRFEIMQFTGLLDKNGVKIFEGDVVEWNANSSLDNQLSGVVSYSNGIYWAQKEGNVSSQLSAVTRYRRCEVISNIHQEVI